MDPCPFVRLIIESLSLNLPPTTKPNGSASGIHSSATPCYCNLRLKNHPSQTAVIPLSSDTHSPPESTSTAVNFHLDPAALRRLQTKPNFLTVSVYTGGWVRLAGLVVGNCWVGSRLWSFPSDFSMNNINRGWITTFSRRKEKPGRERKGWMLVVHDLSGSSIAAASMITPFVPSQGSDRVLRSNPGAWLILRPHGTSICNWKPWGRLEAWRERGPLDGLGYKFELVPDTDMTSRIPISEGTMNIKKGGKFCIDETLKNSRASPLSTIKGFVMSSSIKCEGKISKPMVQVGAQHVTCMADAALFIALSAAINLSMDACVLFSRKLRKEFLQEGQDFLS
ncbi:hypothetical protein E3N88_17346 [Mikania micrantha]|uniref:Uncharacterized protein n=1 Tax=Mikania micrantha TaxID=192012 RepID=A0A5N6NT30_9ASTR|nr:hypothetical protein E3N88_17346 [Mikania micrantha]